MRIQLQHNTRTGRNAEAAVCSFCAQDIYRGERAWRCCGLTACEDCFGRFARLELKPFETVLGKEEENDTL